MSDLGSFPTILIVGDKGVREPLVRAFCNEGYLVLEAQDGHEALEIVRMHSRPIHVMLAETTVDRTVAATLKQYRPNLRVAFVTDWTPESCSDSRWLETALNQVRELLKQEADSPRLARAGA